MYKKFTREDPRNVIKYLKYQRKVDDDFSYLSYGIHEGTVKHIVIIDFKTIFRDSNPIIIDLEDYYNYFRGLKVNHLKEKING